MIQDHHIPIVATYRRCNSSEDNFYHLFFLCSSVGNVWHGLGSAIVVGDPTKMAFLSAWLIVWCGNKFPITLWEI